MDFAFPGTLPVVNKQAVINAIRVAHVLHMKIDDELWFDRKNYFYSDLPKGYQITQQKRPLGKDGYIEIETSNGIKKVGIERLHLEEDTCKQIHLFDETLLDYNRCGIPLLEIVTNAEISSSEEAMEVIDKMRSIVSFLEVSDGKMEEGSLRVDINISLKPIGGDKLGSKAEIKNINTLNNIKRGIEFEIKRQKSLLLLGQNIKQETRRFDEDTKTTVSMREKTDRIDYKIFTEPNIIPIKLSKEFIESAIQSSPELAEHKYQRYREAGLNEYDAKLLISNKDVSNYYDDVIKCGADYKITANWLITNVQSVMNKENITIKELNISPEHFAELMVLISNKEISDKQARELFAKMRTKNMSPNSIKNETGATLLSDDGVLLKIIDDVLKSHPQLIGDYQNGKDRVVGFIVGQVMKETSGKANPSLTNQLVIKRLKEK